MTKSSKLPADGVKKRKAKGTIKRPKDKKSAKRGASQAEARKAMKMMKSLKSPKLSKQTPKQQMKSSKGRKDTKPAKAMKAIVKAMKSMSVMKAKEPSAKPAAKPVAKPAAAKPVAKSASCKRAASPRPGTGRSAAATIARRLRAQAKSALNLPSAAKTKLCTFWLEGKCRRGEQCEFAHGAAEQLESCRRIPCRFHRGAVYPPSCKFAHSAGEGGGTSEAIQEEVTDELAMNVRGIFDSISRSIARAEALSAASSGLCKGNDVVDLDELPEQLADELGPKPQKTLQCKFWLRGKCQRQSGCAFAHGEEEQRAACKSFRCRFDKEGFCKQGSACWYAHGEDAAQDLEPDLGSMQPDDPGSESCFAPEALLAVSSDQMLDVPSSAASMRTSEDDPTKPQKTLLCRFWLKGKCLRLHDCTFAHGPEEQRSACAQIRCRFDRDGFCKMGRACWYAHQSAGTAPYAPSRGGEAAFSVPRGQVLQPPPGLELPPVSLLRAPPGLDLEEVKWAADGLRYTEL